MEPRIVDKAPMPPGQCLFSQDIDGPWIDLGVVAPWIRPYGYLGVKYVESLAREVLDMVPRSEVQSQVEEMQDRLAAYETELEELRGLAGAVAQIESATLKEAVSA